MTNPLIAGFEAGHYTLPGDLVAASEAEDRIRAVLDEQPIGAEAIADTRRRFEEAVHAAALAGKEIPDGSELVEAKMRAAAQDEVLAVLQEALRQAERRAALTFANLQGTILQEHLKPALEETIGLAKKAKAAELPALHERYAVIRNARFELHRLPASSKDTFNMFGEFKDLDRWWPAFYPERSRARTQGMVQRSPQELKERESKPAPEFTPDPRPAGAVERFEWIVANTEPWMPEASAQDRRFEEYLAESRADHGRRQKEWRDENYVPAPTGRY